MLQVAEHASLEEASGHLMPFILRPANWLADPEPLHAPAHRAEYQRRVGTLRVCAFVEVAGDLDVHLRVAFSAPGLTPARAAEYLETFLRGRLPLLPNTEWQVEIDQRRWIHFRRVWLAPALAA